MPKCEHCGGTGHRDPTEIEIVVMDALRKAIRKSSGWPRTSDVWSAMSWDTRPQLNALCNRLNRLFEIGVVRRKRNGKEVQWSL